MLVEALREIGIKRLNDLQKVAIPRVAKGLNVLITAPTGSGKTECATIPILNKMLKMDCKGITFLYITPLRALNRDMIRRLKILADKLGFTIAVRHSDTSNAERRLQSLKPPQILITTPETFQILFLGRRLRESLRNVQFVVIDEIHELADSKRGVQLAIALERLRELANFQVIGLSATLSNAKEIAEFFGMEDVVEWNGKKVYEFRVVKGDEEEIARIVKNHRSSLIFTNTRQTAETLGLKLKKMLKIEVHHSSLSRDVRIEAEKMFAEGKLDALVCTSSMELGIDIGHVDAVVQYNSPREVKRLIQRVGRSGHRLEEVSKGYIVANEFDEILESWAIVKRAKKGLIERIEPFSKPLDVLANQIVAMLMEGYDLGAIYEIVKRVKFYDDLSEEEFNEICAFLEKNGLIRNGKVTRSGRRYFYSNISMIPDEKKVKVVDTATHKVIGYLDESFVSLLDHNVFAMKGELWRIVAIDDVVRVERVESEGVVPSWLGEEIPVPFEVAQDVGKIRRWICNLLRSFSKEEVVDILMQEFNTDEGSCKVVLDVIERCLKEGYRIATDDVVTIEGKGNVVINACFGHKVNETIAKLISLFLPKPFEISVEPYRIRIKGNVDADYVKDVLMKIDVDKIAELIEIALIDSKVMQYKFVEVAKRFGCLDDVGRINIRRLIEKMRGKPVYIEALKEVIHDRLDLDRTAFVLKKIQSGEIEILVYEECSPLSKLSELRIGDIVGDREKAILKAFKERIENEYCYLICLNCGCRVKMKVKQIESLMCIKCGSALLACVNARRDLNEIDKVELYKNANLVMNYGKRAIYALNTFGVGVNTAVKILSKFFKNEEDFLKELIEAEKRFVRTRVFWS
ncbi:DEAD/DEAH box helicase [Archaeoglobus profundus]|uniref:DEAD/DEAH box helicase domain protein n=1 Tax=Archaeoglobus profundus (strain DSM 5631 / JCM 9629 / NBRC 100127 / Av18) TaxID=572546 RepID=D2RFY4_ARCPA|nr:DEAD/DEAH box helicase [Archaeoglobus profundus]ADB57209.1 DEAD/DEAH box helicase domain protein [Archaeoglobus profundus DSM 5631]